jgi:hypothetical protein
MFTSEITVEFCPLPKEKEEAYWATLSYFAEVILNEMKKESELQRLADETPEPDKV